MKTIGKSSWINAFKFDFDKLTSLIINLLVTNKNFETGYYFKEYPQTIRFVNNVLREQAVYIIERLASINEEVIDEYGANCLPMPDILANEFSRAFQAISDKLVKNSVFSAENGNSIFYTHARTCDFVRDVLKVWASELQSQIQLLGEKTLSELSLFDVKNILPMTEQEVNS
jgi:hypothetical protein